MPLWSGMRTLRLRPQSQSTKSATVPPRFEPKPTVRSAAAKFLVMFGVALLIALAVGGIMRTRAEVRAVHTLPSEERAQLYERLLENLRFCKANPGDAFERFCSAEAQFVVTFPECDSACQELARRFSPRPTR